MDQRFKGIEEVVVHRPSVIVRTKDSARSLGGVLGALRSQSIAPEIVVVDSGSSDGTLSIARAAADQVIEITPESFSFGYALNIGASIAQGEVHFALSSHSLPISSRWIELSLCQYEREDVAATNGLVYVSGSREPYGGTFYQTFDDVVDHPFWGFSNTGSSWRAEVWNQFHFNEELPACEDKEWGLRVLQAGWTIAYDPKLRITDCHRREQGLRRLYGRTRREYEAFASFLPECANVPPATIRSVFREWFKDVPRSSRSRWRTRVDYYRAIELAGKYHGLRKGAIVRKIGE